VACVARTRWTHAVEARAPIAHSGRTGYTVCSAGACFNARPCATNSARCPRSDLFAQPTNHKGVTMQLEVLTFCDAAVEYAGRLNVLGSSDTVVVATLPFRYPHCALAMRLRAARIEQGKHTVQVMIVDVDGQSILSVQGEMDVHFQPPSNGAMHLIINAQNLEFATEGEYGIEVAVDGIQLGSTPLFVRVLQQGAS
jgi:hypothetical protein